MTTPTPAKLAEKLARAIHDDIASPLLRARERLRIFGDLKVTPDDHRRPQRPARRRSRSRSPSGRRTSTPRSSGCSSCRASSGAERKRQVALVLDEFQEVDRHRPAAAAADARGVPAAARGRARLPRLQAPHAAAASSATRTSRSGAAPSRWSSGVIEAAAFAPFIERQFERTGRFISAEAVDGDPRDHRRPPLRDAGALLLRVAGGRRRGARGGGRRRRRAGARAELRARPLLAAVGARLDRAAGAADRAGARAGAAAVGRLPQPPQPAGALDGAARGRGAGARRSSSRATAGSCGSSSRSSPPGCCVI